jgi:hypothetical protein
MTSLSLTNQIIGRTSSSSPLKKNVKRVKFEKEKDKNERENPLVENPLVLPPKKRKEVTNRNITHNEAKDCQADRFEQDKRAGGAPIIKK